MSAIIYEVLDMGHGDHGRRGEPRIFRRRHSRLCRVLDKAVKKIIELNGTDEDPTRRHLRHERSVYGGVTHLNDGRTRDARVHRR